MLAELKALGVRITMDDFGTGYSSLAYLQRFPFDKIKIDRSFIRQLGGRPNTQAIVRAMVQLGRSLAVPICAEGVETAGPAGAAARRGLPGGAGLPVRATRSRPATSPIWWPRGAREAVARARCGCVTARRWPSDCAA